MTVTKIPITFSQRRKNKLGRYSAECILTSRWLRFSDDTFPCGGKNIFSIDVMTDSNDKERKICELFIDREDLLKVIENVK